MRRITQAEGRQRGCIYCKDVKRSTGVPKGKNKKWANGIACPYAKCPYKVMDGFESYEDYCKLLSKKFAGVMGGLDALYV